MVVVRDVALPEKIVLINVLLPVIQVNLVQTFPAKLK
jgi:hypothetical protein